MKLGLGTYTFRWSIGHKDLVPDTPMTAFDCLGIAKNYGLEVVQYADNMALANLTKAERQELSVKAKEWGIALELGTESFDAAEVAQYIGIAREIDARILRVALDARDAEKPVADLAAEFTALIPDAKSAGVRIAIENHFKFPSRRMVELLDRVSDENLGVCLDVANSICAGEWPMETVDALAPYAINLHLKDYVITPDYYGVGMSIIGCPLGKGQLDIDAVLAALDRAPKDMSVILEHWLPRAPDMSGAFDREISWLEQHIETARAHIPLA